MPEEASGPREAAAVLEREPCTVLGVASARWAWEAGGSTALEAAVRALPGGFSTRPLPTAEGCSLVVRGDPPGTVGEGLFI